MLFSFVVIYTFDRRTRLVIFSKEALKVKNKTTLSINQVLNQIKNKHI
jgi:hypothetical protein